MAAESFVGTSVVSCTLRLSAPLAFAEDTSPGETASRTLNFVVAVTANLDARSDGDSCTQEAIGLFFEAGAHKLKSASVWRRPRGGAGIIVPWSNMR